MNVQLGRWDHLAKIFPKKSLNSEAVAWLDTYPGSLSVACSGGPDSLILLLLTQLYWPQKRCFLYYYNHHIRKQADIEEAYLKQVAEKLGLTFVAGHREASTVQSEMALREARYAFFEKNLRLYNSQALLLGHHEDDLIETVLMRLFRGSSLDGIVAPRAVHPLKSYTKIRPLLTLQKADLQAACKQCGIHYFVDSTNFEDMCIRNRLRKHILSQLDTIFEGVNWRKGFRRTCTNLIEQSKFLSRFKTKYLEELDLSTHSLSRNLFLKKSTQEQNLLLRQWLQVHCDTNLTFDNLEMIRSSLTYMEEGRINLDKTHYLCVQKNNLRIEKFSAQRDIKFSLKWIKGTIFFPNNAQLSMQCVPWHAELYKKIISGFYKDSEVAILDKEQTTGFYVRNWEYGDRYQPIGFAHEKKVKQLFSERKIKANLRKQLPFITDTAGKILWIPGLPPAEYAKVKSNTKLCVFLIYKKK